MRLHEPMVKQALRITSRRLPAVDGAGRLAPVIQALLFDAAGTLIAPAEPVDDVYARLLARHGIGYGDLRAGFAHAFANAGEPDFPGHADGDAAERAWWRRVVELSVGAAVPDAAFEDLFSHYASGPAWRLLPGVREALEAARDFRLAVVSNFDHRLHRVLDELGIAAHFELVVTSAAARARKPSPGIFRHALDRLKLHPDKVLHVGDSETADGQGAGNAGIRGFVLGRDVADLHDFLRRARTGAE